jgi:hypothetical protein
MDNNTLKALIGSTLKNALYEVNEEERCRQYIDRYKMNIGSYSFTLISKLDAKPANATNNKKKRDILDVLRDEFDRVINTKYDKDFILYNLQLDEYNYRTKVTKIYDEGE